MWLSCHTSDEAIDGNLQEPFGGGGGIELSHPPGEALTEDAMEPSYPPSEAVGETAKEPSCGCGGVGVDISGPPGEALGENRKEPDIEVVATGELVDALPPSFLHRSKVTGTPDA